MIEVPATPAPTSQHTRAPREGRVRGGSAAAGILGARPAILAVLGLLLLSVVIVLVARTRPGFDPFGWVVWGRQTLHWNLDTNGAPSWKPLPFLFTVPFAITGHHAVRVWMAFSVAVSLGGLIFAGRIAYRLTAAAPGRRYAAFAAAAIAGLGVLMIRDYPHFILSAQSDPIIVTLCLGAIDSYLSGRARIAFGLGLLAALGRPEAWPFVGLYALWLFREQPRMRLPIVAGLGVIPVLWFGIPALTAKSFFVAGDLALHSPRALHENKVTGVLDRFFDLHELPLQLAALMSVVVAAVRRDRATLLIAGAALVWVIVEIAFALHGWPAVPRYLFEPVAMLAVLAGIVVGRVLANPPRASGLTGGAGAVAAVALPVLLVGSLVPFASSRISTERKDLSHERARTVQIGRLHGLISFLGGPARILACGQPVTIVEFQSILAWEMGLNVGVAGFQGRRVLTKHPHRAVVLIEPVRRGWRTSVFNPPPGREASCRRLTTSTRLS